MSRFAKGCFLIAFLLGLSAYVLQFMLSGWLNLNSVLLALSGALVVLAIVWDWKLYWEFLTMRTTKHGMNMGLLIVMALILVVCVNYLANKNNKTWDLTAEKLNSLSDQTEKVLGGLKQDIEIKVFYKGQHPATQEKRNKIKQQTQMFKDASGKVKVTFVNAYVSEELARKYLSDQPDRDQAPVVTFVEYGSKKIRVDEPVDEATLTSAMIKATREGDSKIYFVKGHGEKDITSDEDQGLRELAKSLEEAAFKVDSLDLIDKKEIPADAAVLAIVGPSVPYLDAELQYLRDYVKKGGKLFVAADPGVRHNLANLVKPLGVEFANNYVLTQTTLVGSGPATVLGRTFDMNSDITKSLPEGASFAVFPLVSELKPAPDKPADITVNEIVKSDDRSMTVTELSNEMPGRSGPKAVTIGVEVKGKVAAAESAAKPVDGNKADEKKSDAGQSDEKTSDGGGQKTFEAVVFGDSDFLSNRALMAGVNRDLAMNAIAKLADQKDLLSIRPKIPKGSMLTMTSAQRWFILIFTLALPLVLLVSSGVMWFRRRGA